MSAIQAAIFDVDGTLIDSVDLHARAWRDAFREFGREIPFEAIRSQIGKGSDQLLPVFLSPAEIEAEGGALQARRGEIMASRYSDRITPFARVRELFEALRARGVKTALASSAKREELEKYEKLAGIADLVDARTCSEDADKSKPHPDIFQAVLVKLPGVPPERAVVIGDTPHDAEAAAKAGLRSIGVLCGGWPAAALREAGCAEILADPADLLARLEAWLGQAPAANR